MAPARARAERRQLAGGERAEAAGTDAPLGLPGARPRLRRRHVLPVARGAGGARRSSTARCSPTAARRRAAGQRRSGSAASSPRSRRSPARPRAPTSPSCSAGTTGGPSTAPTTRRSCSTCRRSSAPGTGPSSTGTSRSTSLPRPRPRRLPPRRRARTCTCSRTRRSRRWTPSSGTAAIFVCGFFSGVVDENDHVRTPQQTAALRRLLGVRVDEFWPIPPGEEIAVEHSSGASSRRARLVGVARARRRRAGRVLPLRRARRPSRRDPERRRRGRRLLLLRRPRRGRDRDGRRTRPARTPPSLRSRTCPRAWRRAGAPRRARRTSSC